MSDKGSKAHTVFICPLCCHKKTEFQQNIVCGDCVHQDIELTRNSVVENENLNTSMRAQIDLVFEKCNEINGDESKGTEKNDLTIYDPDFTAPTASKIPDSLLPSQHAVSELALHLQKLEITNRKARIHGLERSMEALTKKNIILEERLQTSDLQYKQKLYESYESRAGILEKYSRKLERLEMEIISLRSVATRRAIRQSFLVQYSNYKVMREAFFTNHSEKLPTELCHRPILQISQFLDAGIVPLNTFLEDLIGLQLVLVDLFDKDITRLSYLENLRKLIPNTSFFEAVQSKVNSLLRVDEEASERDQNDGQDTSEELANPSQSQFEVGPSPNFGKVTIENNKIHVPKSFRTMNLQRRSSVKSSDDLSTDIQISISERGSTFVMVPQENGNLAAHQVSGPNDKKYAKPTALNTAEGSLTSSKVDTLAHSNLNGKKIVVVPHRILNKPFSKLRPQEYLKFVSIVAQILVNFNEILNQLLGPAFATRRSKESGSLFGSKILRAKPTGTPSESPLFFYDFKEILGIIADLDEFFQKKLEMSPLGAQKTDKNMSISEFIDGSQSTSVMGADRSIGDSWADNSDIRSVASAYPQISKLKELYTRITSRNKVSKTGPSPPLTNASDDKIYGLLSETSSNGRPVPKMERRANTTESIEIDKTTERKEIESEYDFTTISKKVHDTMSRKKTITNSVSARFEGLGSKSVMQSSKTHLDDWGVVSKSFDRERTK